MSVTLLVFHFEISGIDVKEEQLKNIPLIFVMLLVFHLEISGKDDNEEQLENKALIFVTLLVFHNEISGNDTMKSNQKIIAVYLLHCWYSILKYQV